MKPYWIKFLISTKYYYPPGTKIGCGITAYSSEDAIDIAAKYIFKSHPLPPIESIHEIQDTLQIEQSHVLPNSDDILNFGVWFPQGYR